LGGVARRRTGEPWLGVFAGPNGRAPLCDLDLGRPTQAVPVG